MPKQIECTIIESRPLEPCRAIANRQSDNRRPGNFPRPSRPFLRQKTQTVRPDYFSVKPVNFPKPQDIFPLGLMVDIYA